jgi:hypothetical protein
MTETKIGAVGIIVAVCGYCLERADVFLYMGYTLARGGAIVAALAVVGFAIIVSRGERKAPVLLGIVVAVLIGASGWRLESVRSSPRKGFYLAAIRIKAGMTEHEARSVMAAYRLAGIGEGEESFRFRSAAATEDALIVRYDPVTTRITGTELDLD